jgi:glycine/D-amino acid oxidase-like deaminating enzyme
MKIDYLILGQGIAGTALSYTLLKRGKSVLVVDEDLPHTASKVAAGICNPITGKNLQKTWEADKIFPFLAAFYSELEATLKTKLLHPKAIYHTFKSIEEQNRLYALSALQEYQDFLQLDCDNTPYAGFLANPLGGWESKQSYVVNVPALLAHYRIYLQENNLLRSEKFNYTDLVLTENGVQWKNISARHLVFCEGVAGIQNPYFHWLPFNPVKGDWMKVRIQNFDLQSIISQNIFILPLGEGVLQVGATYEWGNLSTEVSPLEQQRLLEQFGEICKLPFEIIEQRAGVRPASQNRRPFVGIHPIYTQLSVLNGLGSKGVSLAPYMAKELADYLANPADSHQNLLFDTEVNIKRYYQRFIRKKG